MSGGYVDDGSDSMIEEETSNTAFEMWETAMSTQLLNHADNVRQMCKELWENVTFAGTYAKVKEFSDNAGKEFQKHAGNMEKRCDNLALFLTSQALDAQLKRLSNDEAPDEELKEKCKANVAKIDAALQEHCDTNNLENPKK